MPNALQLTKPLAVIDIESTGVSPENDRIVELAIIVVEPDGTVTDKGRRLHPTIPIPAAATEVHGISDADVAECPTFRAVAKSVAEILGPCDIAGYGIVRFDIPLLDAEFERAGIQFDWSERAIVDGLAIFHAYEARDLAAAVKRYAGREHDGAHGAAADAQAALEVIEGQLATYGDLPRAVADLAAAFEDPSRVDWGRKLKRDEEGRIVLNFGKHRGRTLEDLAQNERHYLEVWMLKKASFREEVCVHVRAALEAVPKPAAKPQKRRAPAQKALVKT